MQLYADLRLLSARPNLEEEARAPHHLFGVADGADGWSVGRWLRAATAVLDDVAARDRPAIVVGGTGLYFKALTSGLADIPAIPAAARAEAAALFDEAGEAVVRERLRTADPAAETRIAPADRTRLTRALEVWLATGKPLTAWQTDTRPALAAGTWQAVALAPDREALYARCDSRLEAMVRQGALDEVARLMARQLSPNQPVMKAVGVRELAAHLAGELTLDAALILAQQETRRYAKRQLTWIRNQTPDWPRIDSLDADEAWARFQAL